jgi:hypothetical protein
VIDFKRVGRRFISIRKAKCVIVSVAYLPENSVPFVNRGIYIRFAIVDDHIVILALNVSLVFAATKNGQHARDEQANTQCDGSHSHALFSELTNGYGLWAEVSYKSSRFIDLTKERFGNL